MTHTNYWRADIPTTTGGKGDSSRSSSSLDPDGECSADLDFTCSALSPDPTMFPDDLRCGLSNHPQLFCLCDVTTEGQSICFNDIPCSLILASPCHTSSDCDDDFVCIPLTTESDEMCACRDEMDQMVRGNICVPVCGTFTPDDTEDIPCGPTVAGQFIPCEEDVPPPTDERPPREPVPAETIWQELP